MLKCLKELKTFCNEYEKFNQKLILSPEQWSQIDEIVLCLEPSFKATKKLQTENLTITDVYRVMNLCQIETHNIGKA